MSKSIAAIKKMFYRNGINISDKRDMLEAKIGINVINRLKAKKHKPEDLEKYVQFQLQKINN
jgi:hypothetical protein